MSADLPVLEWHDATRKHHASVAELGVVTLHAWDTQWRVYWLEDSVYGSADSLDDAKAKARQCAKTALRQVLEQLDRTHDPVTGLVVQIVDAESNGQPSGDTRRG